MNTKWMEGIALRLQEALGERFGLEGGLLNAVLEAGQNALTGSLKNYLMKNGSREVEELLLRKREFEGSGLQKETVMALTAALMPKNHDLGGRASELSAYSAAFLVEQITDAFQQSGESRDQEGICRFLGVDSHLLKMINSPMGRMFGKFF